MDRRCQGRIFPSFQFPAAIAGKRDTLRSEIALNLHLLLLSGPPRSGKNMAGAAIGRRFGADHFALSDQLKIDTHSFYGLGNNLPVMHFENVKDSPCLEFGGLTPRQAYIDYSENYLKPRFGSCRLGEIAVSRIKRNIGEGRLSILSGVGFLDEVRPVVEAARSDCCLHLVVVAAADAESPIVDSRERLDLRKLGVSEFSVANDRTGAFIDEICSIVNSFRAGSECI